MKWPGKANSINEGAELMAEPVGHATAVFHEDRATRQRGKSPLIVFSWRRDTEVLQRTGQGIARARSAG